MPSNRRAEERPPNNAPPENEDPEADNDDALFNGMLARNPGNLAVTSSLHPFWHTKKGKAVIGLVMLALIGGIVGGAIGGAKAHSDMKRQLESIVSTPPANTSLSCACSPSVAGAVFSVASSDPSDIV